MNILYYKNFGEDKSSSTHLTFKKKKDTRKSKNIHFGQEGHFPNCTCEVCSNEYPLRTHLLLDMSYSRLDQHSSTRRHTTVSSMFNFFGFGKKSSLTHAGRDDKGPSAGVKFGEDTNMESQGKGANGGVIAPLEPVSLSTLKQDCFMIPMARLKNFFPAGHPIPSGDAARLRMVETSEPNIRVLFHMIGPAVPFLPSLSSPLVDLHRLQQDWIVKAFKSTVAAINVGSVLQGMVLLNLEKGGELGAVVFPFMVVWAIDSKKCDYKAIVAKVKQYSLEMLDPAKTGFTSTHYLDTFDEVATLARPPLEKLSRRASTPATGYIISVFKVFVGDDGQKFERNWLAWSGAKALYCSMTSDVGLRRLTLHKSGAQNGFYHYILLCDCSNFLLHLCSAVRVVPRLRMRLCGDTGLYRPICTV